jgi:tRNA dimethylallyltransferase
VSVRRPERFVILVGPTAVGKTGVSIELARRLSGEIVSADSRLVYRMMDIGTAKPGERIRREIPHHMIDIVNPDEEYTCRLFEIEARRVIRRILEQGRLPIVVGGSGLYVRALTHGIFGGPERDDELRQLLLDEAGADSQIALWEELKRIDPVKAQETDPHNLPRVLRALEVYRHTGTPMSELELRAEPFEIPWVMIGLTLPRRELYAAIDRRVDEMMQAGFLDEVKMLVEKGYGETPVLHRTLGYRELLSYIEGKTTLAKAVEMIKRNTRRFAKRQMTWFRNQPHIHWLQKGTDPFSLLSSSQPPGCSA